MASPVGATLMLPDEVVSLASGAAAVGAFTDIDISAYTGSQAAKAAVLRVQVKNQTVGGATVEVQLRENGTNPTNPRLVTSISTDPGRNSLVERTVVVPVDENEILEYKVTDSGAGTLAWHIWLEGWYL